MGNVGKMQCWGNQVNNQVACITCGNEGKWKEMNENNVKEEIKTCRDRW